MSNDANADLIYALLALDSYNRGYGSGISGLDSEGVDAKIGNYSIIQNISQAGWETAGFYALAYKKGNEVVVSFRGTDSNSDRTADGAGGSDLENGYGIALGLPGEGEVRLLTKVIGATQGALAEQFYNSVAADGGSASNDNRIAEWRAA